MANQRRPAIDPALIEEAYGSCIEERLTGRDNEKVAAVTLARVPPDNSSERTPPRGAAESRC